MIKCCGTENPLGSEHLMPARQTPQRDPAGITASLPWSSKQTQQHRGETLGMGWLLLPQQHQGTTLFLTAPLPWLSLSSPPVPATSGDNTVPGCSVLVTSSCPSATVTSKGTRLSCSCDIRGQCSSWLPCPCHLLLPQWPQAPQKEHGCSYSSDIRGQHHSQLSPPLTVLVTSSCPSAPQKEPSVSLRHRKCHSPTAPPVQLLYSLGTTPQG